MSALEMTRLDAELITTRRSAAHYVKEMIQGPVVGDAAKLVGSMHAQITSPRRKSYWAGTQGKLCAKWPESGEGGYARRRTH